MTMDFNKVRPGHTLLDGSPAPNQHCSLHERSNAVVRFHTLALQLHHIKHYIWMQGFNPMPWCMALRLMATETERIMLELDLKKNVEQIDAEGGGVFCACPPTGRHGRDHATKQSVVGVVSSIDMTCRYISKEARL